MSNPDQPADVAKDETTALKEKITADLSKFASNEDIPKARFTEIAEQHQLDSDWKKNPPVLIDAMEFLQPNPNESNPEKITDEPEEKQEAGPNSAKYAIQFQLTDNGEKYETTIPTLKLRLPPTHTYRVFPAIDLFLFSSDEISKDSLVYSMVVKKAGGTTPFSYPYIREVESFRFELSADDIDPESEYVIQIKIREPRYLSRKDGHLTPYVDGQRGHGWINTKEWGNHLTSHLETVGEFTLFYDSSDLKAGTFPKIDAIFPAQTMSEHEDGANNSVE